MTREQLPKGHGGGGIPRIVTGQDNRVACQFVFA